MSTTYQYTLGELSALGVTELSLSYRSLQADSASLRCPMGADTQPPLPWEAGDRIVISDEREEGSPRLFNGRVKNVNTTLSGNSWAVQVELVNDVDVLDATTFAYIDGDGEVQYAQSFYEPREEGDSSYGERLTSSRTVCERCFDWALGGGAMDCDCNVQFDSTIMGIAGTGSQSCWSLIYTAMRWVPDAATAMRYSSDGDVLQFLTAREMPTLAIDVTGHRIRNAAGMTVGSFGGVESCELTPRPDLVPPVCAVTGSSQLVLPEGGDVRAPGAFIYHVRGSGGSVDDERVAQAARQAAIETSPWQEVRGRRAPVSPNNAIEETNMKGESNLPPAQLLSWWQGFGAFSLLKKLGVGSLNFGNPLFEPVAVTDAYPEEDAEEEAPPPANYENSPQTWPTLYLHDDGSFPASPAPSRNLGGLKWCRGRLSQYVWLEPGASLPGNVSRDQILEFFSGTSPVTKNGRRKMTRYALLSVEGVWINRRRVRFREGDNATEEAQVMALSDGDDGVSEPATTGNVEEDKYQQALRDFYAATRKLYYDGSITLTGVRGNPGSFLANGVNIQGLLPEWQSMQTPCNAVDYDPISRRATLALGSREQLTMDELIQRQELGSVQAASRNAGNTYNPLDSTPDSGTPPSGGDDEEEELVEMIAPSVNAYASANAKGRELKPFEVYREGTKWMMNGGVTPEGIEVEPVDITAHHRAGRRFFYRASKDGSRVLLRWKDAAS